MLVLRRARHFDPWSKEASIRSPHSVLRGSKLIDRVFIWGVFAWLMFLVWGGVVVWAVVLYLVLS
jgi:hypothetical protein